MRQNKNNYDQKPNLYEGIKEFRFDKTSYWRLDSVGYLLRGNVLSDPKIHITFSKVVNLELKRFDLNAVDPNIKKRAEVGVSLLPILHMGSIWKNGYLVYPLTTGFAEEQTYPLTVSPHNVTFIRAGGILPEELKCYEGLYCLGIKVNDDPFHTIIPCNEIFRYYFATSTSLTKKLVLGSALKLSDKDKINDLVMFYNQEDNKPRTYKIDDDTYVVCVRKELYKSDAWTLSRILGEPIALSEACRVHNTILEANTARGALYLKMQFPFVGRTDLQVLRVPFVSQKTGQRRYLVLKIQNCSYPLPFGHVFADRENSGDEGLIELGEEKANWPNKKLNEQKIGHGTINEPRLRNDVEPNNEYARQLIDLPEQRFSFLADKRLLDIKKDISHYKSQNSIILDNSSMDKAPGDGLHGESPAAPIGINIDVSGISKRSVQLYFNELMEALALLKISMPLEWKTVVLNVPDVNDRYFTTSLMLSEFPIIGKPRSNAWVYYDCERKLVRRFLLVEVSLNNNYFYLFEIERRPTDTDYALYVLNYTNKCRNAGFPELVRFINNWANSSNWRKIRVDPEKKNRRIENSEWYRQSIKHSDSKDRIASLSKRIKTLIT